MGVMTLHAPEPPPSLSPEEVEARLVEIEKGQQLAGHFPDEDALGRARRILEGELTLDEAIAEIDSKYSE